LTGDGEVVGRRRRSLGVRLLWLAVILACLGGLAGAGGVVAFLVMQERTPREWAPYLERRADRHRSVIVDATGLVTGWLMAADRLAVAEPVPVPPALGASPARSGAVPPGRLRPVDSQAALEAAVASAVPGDVIVLRSGTYKVGGWSAIKLSRPGTPAAPITLRAARLGDAVIETVLVETFKLSAPHWRIENLVVRGACGGHSDCEHAVHVVGGAAGTVIRNNRFEDFNAQIKVNGEGGLFPDNGVIEGNTLTNAAARETENPITPIDLVAASGWRVSGNFIADFVRASEQKATYGAFFKGEGENNVMERNLVVCEWKLRGLRGQRIGLSLGGGGTGMGVRRLEGRTGFEQTGGVIRDNLIANCSDDGIYINQSARSVIDRNTLLDTAGIDVRFVESSATVTANIVDGAIRARDGATLRGGDNDVPPLLGLFVGWHPQRGHFRDPAKLDLTWAREPEYLADPEQRTDLCGQPRGPQSPRGAFAFFGPCLTGQ